MNINQMENQENSVSPDSISMADLIALSETAKQEDEVKFKKGPFDGLTQEQVEKLAFKTIDEAEDICGHPMLAKEIINQLLQKLASWHASVSENLCSDSDERELEMGLGWARDCGKFQAIYNILETIELCENDWVVRDEADN